jgi:hypothetical protein
MPDTAAELLARFIDQQISAEKFFQLAEELSIEERSLLLSLLLRQRANQQDRRPN